MIRVIAPSRLHFGPFSLPGDNRPTHWPDLDGRPTVPARHFGGVGLMVERPGVCLTVAHAETWSATGPSADRALSFGCRFCESLSLKRQFAIRVERCAPEHVGLGTGTQLAMSVGYGIAHIITADTERWHIARYEDVARHVGRGLRSALGIHGVSVGGFLIEGGKRTPDEISPLSFPPERFPSHWRILLIIPSDVPRVHGSIESQAFSQLARVDGDIRQTDALCRLVVLGMLPAINEQDLDAFGEALYDYNRRAGEFFKPWQGGTYSHPRVAELVRLCRESGVKAVGQSSWGPTVFAIVASSAQARELRDRFANHHRLHRDEMVITKANTGGIMLHWPPSGPESSDP
jgi:beta-ribofuranosylaminobenzene 5'-phosphate synthase